MPDTGQQSIVMRIFTTLIATAAFALHVLLGCCAHHAHGADEAAGHRHDSHVGAHVHLPVWLWSAPADCCHHQHEHGGKTSEQPPPHAPCHDLECVYLVCGHAELPAADGLVMPFVQLEAASAREFAAHISDIAECEEISPHVRRHLALCHFLN